MGPPKEWVQRGLALAGNATIFGRPLAELTPDELLAACAHGWDAERRARDQALRDVSALCDLRSAFEPRARR